MDAAASLALPDAPISPASIAHLLATNSAPEGLESRIASAHLAELEKQAAFLESVMVACADRHADVLRSIRDHKSILSPVRRLPNELLVEIFMVVVRDTYGFDDNVPRPWSQPPWTLARVCRRWTAVALGTSLLWSRVVLHLDLIGLGQGAVTMTELLHQRSGSAPLTVEIHDDRDRETHNVLNAAFTHCERWKHVQLSGLFLSTMNPPIPQIARIHGRLPALTTLKIHAELKDDADILAEFRDIFAVAPNLTAVDAWFHDEDGFLCRPPFGFPWRQLTTLSISFARSEEALPIFPQLSTIVDLRVQVKWADPFPTQNPITLPHLRMLELYSQRAMKPPGYLSLLSCLTAPLLEHLGVHDEADEECILRFITQSGCKLRSFHFFESSMISSEVVLSLVHEMPCLRHLKVSHLDNASDPQPVLLIIQAIHSHWLAVRSTSGVSARLSVCIADNNRPTVDPEVSSLMQKDGLFVEIVRGVWQFDSLVDAKFA
ncbi:hypothetical protein FB45DRAFT_1098288 [Roridomyces roridus]|uniref:F-box domain-containing protein n=1 Tax=Roridomyces roridus TaxID=1738132 RepID=A0AAD7FZD2_9AGAR|nr:hypothetical protein FB45DRAFT_1098288 [Roridomyces roridus]